MASSASHDSEADPTNVAGGAPVPDWSSPMSRRDARGFQWVHKSLDATSLFYEGAGRIFPGPDVSLVACRTRSRAAFATCVETLGRLVQQHERLPECALEPALWFWWQYGEPARLALTDPVTQGRAVARAVHAGEPAPHEPLTAHDIVALGRAVAPAFSEHAFDAALHRARLSPAEAFVLFAGELDPDAGSAALDVRLKTARAQARAWGTRESECAWSDLTCDERVAAIRGDAVRLFPAKATRAPGLRTRRLAEAAAADEAAHPEHVAPTMVSGPTTERLIAAPAEPPNVSRSRRSP